jgi:hypothetical protein
MNRENWLSTLADMMAPAFATNGYELPKIRMAIGFPSTGRKGKRIGECWSGSASEDGTFEIMIRPDRHEPMDVAAILAHEIAHAAVGIPAGHGPKFRKCVKAIGLTGPMRSTTAGPEFVAWMEPVLRQLGPLPHARLGLGDSSGPKKQSTRMLKAVCQCDGCGYTVRLTKKWAEIGAPICPVHGEPMTVEMPEEEEPEDGGE